MALSAASPFYRGFVSDIDCRWGVISASVDDRTEEERGLKVRPVLCAVATASQSNPEFAEHVRVCVCVCVSCIFSP